MNSQCFLWVLILAWLPTLAAALRYETFDRQPPNWIGLNNRNSHFSAREVRQDFGYSSQTSHAGGQPGEIGGLITPAGEAAYYAWPLGGPSPLTNELRAAGKLFIREGPGHFMVGFFNPATLKEWRTANSLVARINSRGKTTHYHVEYGTSKWRAGAGVIGHIVPGERITALEIPNGQVIDWELHYSPASDRTRGKLILKIGPHSGECEIDPDHFQDGLEVTHFGLFPITKTYDSPGEIYLDDLTINGRTFDFHADPNWEALHNRRQYLTEDTRPKFNFGWSPTAHAGGRPGELGGLIFRGDCREPARLGAYGDAISRVTLRQRLVAKGKVAMLRGLSDATASIGFYNSEESLRVNDSQKHSIPMDYLGLNIEGPSPDGFFFYPVYRVHGDGAGVPREIRRAPRIYPDGKVHDWSLVYEPAGNSGKIVVTLDEQSVALEIPADHLAVGASFDRFGICTPWVDGNSVTVYFDDLTYTSGPD